MKTLKRIGLIFVTLLSIQTITYFAFGENLLIQEIGKNYETFALGYEENVVEHLVIYTDLQLTNEHIKENFKKLDSFNYTICKNETKAQVIRNKENSFLYSFTNMTRNPFSINLISEGEAAEDYGASWESKYVWVFYKWILLDKHNTGIS